MTPQNSNLASELSLLLALATLWGSSYTFIKIGVETIPPVTLIAARTLIAGCILLAVLRSRRVRLPRDRA
ncbi:EamA family transporter, partial [Bradyrhizobium sp. Lot11]